MSQLTPGVEVSKILARGKITHIVVAAPEGKKFDTAKQWGLSIVKSSWVWTMAHEGRIDPVEQHAFGPEGEIVKTESASSEERKTPAGVGTPADSGRQAPLSATERVLNSAMRSPSRSRSNPPSHTASPASKPAQGPVQDDVTAQLRRLAEGDAAPRAVLVSRACCYHRN